MPDIPASIVNAAFVDKIENGFVKEAEVSATSFIRKKIREESFIENKILTPIPITPDQLDKDEDLDQLKKIVEIEPDSTATWISFKGLPASRYLKQEAGVVYFATIASEKVVKNIFELKTRDNDVRKIISDNHAKDILAEQDGRLIEQCRQIVTDFPDQYKEFNGGLTTVTFAEALKMLPKKKFRNACVLMNESTVKDILKWDSQDVGYEITTDHYRNGVTEGKIFGIKLITTIKNDIVQDNEVFFFAPEDYLGKMFVLQDTTMFMKSEGLTIEFYAYKTLGIAILNTEAIALAKFTP